MIVIWIRPYPNSQTLTAQETLHFTIGLDVLPLEIRHEGSTE